MAFDFTQFMKTKTPEQQNAGADALMQSMGASPQTSGVMGGLMNNTDKQDLSDAEDIMSIFGGGAVGGV